VTLSHQCLCQITVKSNHPWSYCLDKHNGQIRNCQSRSFITIHGYFNPIDYDYIVRWQFDLENTKESPLHKPLQDQRKLLHWAKLKILRMVHLDLSLSFDLKVWPHLLWFYFFYAWHCFRQTNIGAKLFLNAILL